MRTITIKVPHNIVALLSKREQLNPSFFRVYLSIHVESGEVLKSTEPLKEGAMYYSFKLDKATHQTLKQYAEWEGVALAEYVGRLLHHYIEE